MKAPTAIQNHINDGIGYIEQPCDMGNAPSVCPQTRYGFCLKVGHFSIRMKFPLWDASTISVLPAGVFRPRNPFEIFRTVIAAVAIKVIYRSPFKRRAMKRLANNPMHKPALTLSVNASVEAKVSGEHELTTEDAPRSRLKRLVFALTRRPVSILFDAPEAGSIMTGQARHWFPNLNFWRICGVSHSAVLSRSGQGRALLTQRFRPIFHNRIMVCSQAQEAGA